MHKKQMGFRRTTLPIPFWEKFLLTRRQWRHVLQWIALSGTFLMTLLLQDVLLSRIRIMNVSVDLVPCFLLVLCMLQGAEHSCVFVLLASLVYAWSGSGPGLSGIPWITILAILLAIVRQTYLRQGFWTLLLCTGVGLFLYEIGIFVVAVCMGHTGWMHVDVACWTALDTLVLVPILCPMLVAIGRIGGEPWIE